MLVYEKKTAIDSVDHVLFVIGNYYQTRVFNA